MNTFEAYNKYLEAQANNNSMKFYDYDKAFKLAKEKKVKKVEFYMYCDREYTSDEIDINKIKEEPDICGIKGSIWATPMICIKGEEIECWKKL